MLVLFIGIAALVAVVAGVLAVIALARKQESDDRPPPSLPSDYVAPVSSGGYHFRHSDESPEDFHKRIDQENREALTKK